MCKTENKLISLYLIAFFFSFILFLDILLNKQKQRGKYCNRKLISIF